MLDDRGTWVRRVGVWAIAFVVSASTVAACGGGSGFSCSSDTECELAGVAGVCVSGTSQCAYPDGQCESGFSYPAGAGAQLGGSCADGPFDVGTTSDASGSASLSTTGEPLTTGNADGTTTTPAVDDGSTTGGATGSTGAVATTDDPSTTDGATTDEPTTAGESTTGPPLLCPNDAYEPNDTALDATDLLVPVGDCGVIESAVLEGMDDQDWYFVGDEGCWLEGAQLDFEPAGDLSMCVVYEGCMGGAASVDCGGGATPAPDGSNGCCHDAGFSVVANCNNGALYVVAYGPADMCVEYQFEIQVPGV